MPRAVNVNVNQELFIDKDAITPSSHSPLSYFGGKAPLWNVVKPLLPIGVTEIASPFIGGGGLELKIAASNIKVHASDRLEPLVNFWQHFLDDAVSIAERAHELFPLSTPVLRSMYPQDDDDWSKSGYYSLPSQFEQAVHFWLINKQTWCGKSMISYGASDWTNISTDYFSPAKWHNWRNPNLKVKQMDWEDSMDEHHDKFLYLDPPYIEKEQYYGLKGEDHSFDHDKLADRLKAHKHGWILSYGDHPYIHELYADFMIMRPKWYYGTSKSMSSELLILNGLDMSEDFVKQLIDSTNKFQCFVEETAQNAEIWEQLPLFS